MLEKVDLQLVRDVTFQLELADPAIVEKDWYVTQVLHAMSDVKHPYFQLIFIGGTFLAKGHRVVERMSEDIDFKIAPFAHDNSLTSKKIRENLSVMRQDILAVIKKHVGLEPKEHQITKGNNNKFTQILLDYPSAYQTNSLLRPQIKVELTVQAVHTKIEQLSIGSLIYEVIGEKSGLCSKLMSCISLDETAAEKWAALGRRVADAERQDNNPEKSIIRHLFDLHCIEKQRGITEDFERLVPDVVLRDRLRFKGKSPYFFKHTLNELIFGTQALVKNSAWEKRYQEFTDNMVFQKQCSTFQEALKTLVRLNKRAFSAIKKAAL